MSLLKDEELKYIIGGLNVTGSLIASFTRAITTALDVGRSLGTAIIRIRMKKLCPIR